MIKNYLKIALRVFYKNKLYTGLNTLGLTLGFLSFLYISLYVIDELSFDNFHPNSDNLYRLNLTGKFDNQIFSTTCSSFPIAKAMVENIPEVNATTRVYEPGDLDVIVGDEHFSESGFIAADSNFFKLLGYSFLEGNVNSALVQPRSIVISEELVDKYFSDSSPLSKTIQIGNDEFRITGVMEKKRSDSHLQFDAVISSSTYPFLEHNEWLANMIYTYYTVNDGVDSKTIDKKLKPIVDLNVGQDWEESMGKSMDQFIDDGGEYRHFSLLVKDIHLKSTLEDEPVPIGSMGNVYIFSLIGLFILALASINYINLNTSESLRRSKEIGLRKVFGSFRSAIVKQFMLECLVFVTVSLILSVIFLNTFLPMLNEISGKSLNPYLLFNPLFLLGFLILVILITFLAGLYPSFILTKYKVSEAVKGKLSLGVGNGVIRNGLVVFQFMIAIVLVISSLTIRNQLQYLQGKNLGIDKHKLVMIKNLSDLKVSSETMIDKFRTESNVDEASFASTQFPGVRHQTLFRDRDGVNELTMSTYNADDKHLISIGVDLVTGKFFNKGSGTNKNSVVINQAAFKALNWESIDNKFLLNFDSGEEEVYSVIGVVNDFNFDDLHTNIKPLVIRYTDYANNLYLRYTGAPSNIVNTLNDVWSKLGIDQPLEYSFVDNNFDASFRSEQRLSRLVDLFTLLTVLLACLGLFGLSSYLALQKAKEVAIRKILGASAFNVTNSMAMSFTKLVVMSFILAVLPTYYYLDKWLADFPYRIDINIATLILGGVSAICIAYLTVSYHSYKAASINIIKSLRKD